VGDSLDGVTKGRARDPLWRAVLVCGGVWLGHLVEHFRVEGPAGLVHELSHSVHVYMLPLGALLVALAALTGAAWMRMAAALRRRLAHATEGLARAFRAGRGSRRRPDAGEVTVAARTHGRLALAASLSMAQLLLYGIQENLERALEGDTVSVIGVFGGAHWGAAPVQVGVACVLATLVVACRTRVADLARRVDAVERLAHWLARARLAVLPAPFAGRVRSFTPVERFGRHLLQRPPPQLRFSH
jgi:hypothetical protein